VETDLEENKEVNSPSLMLWYIAMASQKCSLSHVYIVHKNLAKRRKEKRREEAWRNEKKDPCFLPNRVGHSFILDIHKGNVCEMPTRFAHLRPLKTAKQKRNK